MSFRTKVGAIAVAAAACVLLAPAAMASSGPVQVTGKQLKSALLPTSDFQPGYTASNENDSGGKLEHGRLYQLSSMKCETFWELIGDARGFGETAFAANLVENQNGTASVFEIFEQSVYQFGSSHAASSFYSQLNAKYRSCRSTTASDTTGGTLRWSVRSQAKRHVGGHQAVLLVERTSDSKVSGGALTADVLWTVDGTDLYMISTTLVNTSTPQPTQSSLTLKLISRVIALR
jgi:PknH-like extracellular domain